MRRLVRNAVVLVLMIALTTLLLFACEEERTAPLPQLAAHVNDTANVLSADDRARLDLELTDYEARTGHQFVLLTVETIRGESVEPYANRVFRTWALGDEKRDDGLLFVIVTKDRKTRIEVGYGLEGVIPDAAAKRVLDGVKPALRAGEFGAGAAAAFVELKQLADREALVVAPKEESACADGTCTRVLIGWSLLSVIVIGWFVTIRVRARRRLAARSLEMWEEAARRDLGERKRASARRVSTQSEHREVTIPKAPPASSPSPSPYPAAPSRPATPPPARRPSTPVPVVVDSSPSSSPSVDSSPASSAPDISPGGGSSGGGGATSDF